MRHEGHARKPVTRNNFLALLYYLSGGLIDRLESKGIKWRHEY